MTAEIGLDQDALNALASATSAEQLYSSLALPVDPPSIRVLDLDAPTKRPDGTWVDSPLTGRLRVVRLQDSPIFTALSYTWDENVASHNILCEPHGCHLKITANCHAALQQVRRGFGSVTIWVDSICIHQENAIEKRTQITLMNEVYSWAKAVYIWLGPGDEKSDSAMEYLQLRGSIMTRLPFAWLAATNEGDRGWEWSLFQTRVLEDPMRRLRFATGRESPSPSSDDIEVLLHRKWVHRAWTFQEVILARNPIVLCGHKILYWEDLVSAIYCSDETWLDVEFLFGLNSKIAFTADLPAMQLWRSIIDIWLLLPRPCHWNGLDVTPSCRADEKRTDEETPASPKRSMVEQLELLAPTLHRSRFLRSLHIFGLTIFVPPLIAIWPFTIFKVIEALNSKVSLNKWYGGLFFLGIFLLCLTFWYYLKLASFIRTYSVLLRGRAHRRSLKTWSKSSSSVESYTLNGIQTALRRRVSSKPADKAFALCGVLEALGSKTSEPNYNRPLGHIYRLFLADIITWNSLFVAAIVDAGDRPASGAPTWVPDWGTPGPSQWLSSRYMIANELCYGSSDAVISGRKLRLKARLVGSVGARAGSDHQAKDTEASTLCNLVVWINHVRRHVTRREPPYDHPEIFLYAVIRGLAPRREEPLRWEPVANGLNGPLSKTIRELQLRKELWEHPYNFSTSREDFESFCKFYDAFSSAFVDFAPGSGGMALEVGDLENMLDRLRHTEGCLDYLNGITNQLAIDKRCLFVLSNQMVGSGPTDMQDGDEVALLGGVPTPMVLRRTWSLSEQETFTVIGAALVHGIMHAEDFRNLGHGFSWQTRVTDVTLV